VKAIPATTVLFGTADFQNELYLWMLQNTLQAVSGSPTKFL